MNVCTTMQTLVFRNTEGAVVSGCRRFDYSAWMAKILATPEHDKEANLVNFSSALPLPSKMKEACSIWILNHWINECIDVILKLFAGDIIL